MLSSPGRGRPGVPHVRTAMNSQELRTIRGYVQALPRAHGREDAAKVAVVADDGTHYHILHKGAGMDLVDFISADVEVRGVIHPLAPENAAEPPEDEAKAFSLSVRGYQLTDGYDDPWYDDDA